FAERIGHYPNGVYEIPTDSDENGKTRQCFI
ncbi:unnamed protein product, partial [Rotaria magnacalcarata]